MIRRLLVPVAHTVSSLPPQTTAATTSVTNTTRRCFGTRGARGHGWFIKYRSGRGGRHLQGEYFDRESPEQCIAWNNAILQLGCQRVYVDIVMEPRRSTVALKSKVYPLPTALDNLTGVRHRLTMDLASTVMAETSQNFIDLLCKTKGTTHGYVGSRLFRVEKNVGIKGGDVLTNTGKAGKAALHGTPLQMEITKDPLAMWHIPGTVTMMVPTVGEIDSRFLLVSNPAPHIDGICRAFGKMTPDSLEIVDRWQSSLITSKGIPTAYDLIIVEGGLVEMNDVPAKEHVAVAASLAQYNID